MKAPVPAIGNRIAPGGVFVTVTLTAKGAWRVEQDLVRRAQAGDEDAYTALVWLSPEWVGAGPAEALTCIPRQ